LRQNQLIISVKAVKEENMPKNKRESLIYTIMMCFFMVLWMSIYNVSISMGKLSLESIREGWMGLPLAYVIAVCCDWFLVSGIAKGFAFRYLVKPDSSDIRKVLSISCCMVIPMVIVMSFYGTLEVCVTTGAWDRMVFIYLVNIPRNFIMALPLQLLVAGPIVRTIFRKAFPEGKVLA
jgi:hypothetical protein